MELLEVFLELFLFVVSPPLELASVVLLAD